MGEGWHVVIDGQCVNCEQLFATQMVADAPGVNACGDEPRHAGHFSRLGGQWFCDTCGSPYCELL